MSLTRSGFPPSLLSSFVLTAIQYDDKYALAEFITKSTMAAQLNVLECLGVTGSVFRLFPTLTIFSLQEAFLTFQTSASADDRMGKKQNCDDPAKS